MIRPLRIVCAVCLLAMGQGCKKQPSAPPQHAVAAYVPDPSSVAFDITPLSGTTESTEWVGSYTSHGKTARFRLEFASAKPLSSSDPSEPVMKSGEGRFVAEDGSDASGLLIDLRKALEAKRLPSGVKRSKALSFAFVNLGEHQSQAKNGGFNNDPPGDWTCMKIFIGEGEQEAELFLNLDPALGKGQFSIKDPDYGDLALKYLAMVL